MEKYSEYINKINEALLNQVGKVELVTDTSNVVFRVNTLSGEVLYAKFYLNKSSHIDHEMELYDLVDNKYLKEVAYASEKTKFTIFKEVKGKTIDELSESETEKYKDQIVEGLIDFFSATSNCKVDGFGLIDENFSGKNESFHEFITQRQMETQEELKDYPIVNELFTQIYSKYKDILVGENSVVPIDTNMKNIMITEDEKVKFIDPGEIISAPILMGYGDFTAHTYKTSLYESLVKKLNLSDDDEKRLRIYAIFSSMNILAFLKRVGVTDLESVIPYGNKHTFYDLIKSHMEFLGIEILDKKENFDIEDR